MGSGFSTEKYKAIADKKVVVKKIDWNEKGEGEHNGDVSWTFLVKKKTQFMGDLRGIDCESETDMDEIVDEVFAFLDTL